MLLLALGFTVWTDARRIVRLAHIAELSRGDSQPDPASPTGYVGGVRERVLPDHDGRSHEWIAQTQQMLATGDWRVRRIATENAPQGRESHAASPYRWWLGALALLDHTLTGTPHGLAVERAALYADPLLHCLLLIAATLFSRRHFGSLAAITAALGGALLFPFAARFFPGAPDDSALETILAIASLLPLLAGWFSISQPAPVAATSRASGKWFVLAGIFGGLGCWVNPASQVLVIGGVILGALGAEWLRRDAAPVIPAPWRAWSLAGGLTVLLASLLEFYPDHLGGWELRAVHPLYGLAWMGAGECVVQAAGWMRARRLAWKSPSALAALLGLLALLALPFALYRTGNPGFLAVDGLFFRLVNQPGAMGPSLAGWIRTGGFTAVVWSTLLPLVLILPATWLLIRRQAGAGLRSLLVLAAGPLLLLLPVAFFQLSRWLLVDALLLVVWIATAAVLGLSANRPRTSWVWPVVLVLFLLPGLRQLRPEKTDNVLSVQEAVGVVERDLAHWLAARSATPPLVLAPPGMTTNLNYYGGLRGIPTLSWENQEGLAFSLRIAVSVSRNETAALLRQRGVNYIVLPSWDGFFAAYVQAASVQTSELFHAGLMRWNLPPWLRPVPYEMPSLPGFENQSVRIFEVVDDQDPPLAASRLTEYFIETGRRSEAHVSYQALLKYPADFTALVARTQYWAVAGDADNFTKTFALLSDRLAAGADRYLPWDRRVRLAVVLAQGNRMDLARPQAVRYLAEASETRLRGLSSEKLYQLLALNRALGLEFSDAALRTLSRQLLPEGMRKDFAP